MVARPRYQIGDTVKVVGDDAHFIGEIRCVYLKRSGVFRYILENQDGNVHTYSERNMTLVSARPADYNYCPNLPHIPVPSLPEY